MPATPIMASSLATATLADFKKAQLYHGPSAWVTRHGKGGEHWIFERVDGGFDSFARVDLQHSPWWRFCDAVEVLSLEAQLHPVGRGRANFVERPISYVARAERRVGGLLLIAGSLLSEFFEGESGFGTAQTVCGTLRAGCPDARVFQAGSVAEAKRWLQGIDVQAEKLERRVQEIRDEQAAARTRLEIAK